MMADALLQNRRVLVVEDEYMVADAMERKLRRAGAVVLGPVPSVAQALDLLELEGDIDGAVLDINLGDQKVYPVVDLLLARGTPCVFATGNDRADVPAAYAHLIRCEKPIDGACLVSALAGGVRPDPVADVAPTPPAALRQMRHQLLDHVQRASDLGYTLLAAKLCEALDALDLEPEA
jgi:CheY-like chemotaxis protein